MPSTLVASYRIQDTSRGKDYEFQVPDILKLTNAVLTQGDEVLMPVNLRDGAPTFWESGGKSTRSTTSIACIVADEGDGVPEAILFNKLGRQPNGKHALISLREGYRIYAGRLSVKSALAPKLRIVKLIYKEVGEGLAKFEVDQVFTNYQDIEECKPAERLMDKLFTTEVRRPYYTNGWSVSNLREVVDREGLTDGYMRLMSEMVATTHFTEADEFLDAVEDELTRLENPKLSAAFQWVDFNRGIVGIKTLSGMKLAAILESVKVARVTATFTIDIKTLFDCYNSNIIFNCDDVKMMELAMAHDHDEECKYALRLDSRIYGLMRGWRG